MGQTPAAGDTARSATNPVLDKSIPVPRAKPLALIDSIRQAAKKTRVASVSPITAAPTEPLAISPLPGSEPRSAAQAVPAQPQPVQPVQPSFGAQQPAATPTVGQGGTALQPAQPAPAPAQAPQAVASAGDYVIQLASYKDQTSALAGFQDLRARHPSLLGRFQPLVSKKTVGNFGTFYRLQVGPIANQQSGSQICASLLAAGEKDCLVKRR